MLRFVTGLLILVATVAAAMPQAALAQPAPPAAEKSAQKSAQSVALLIGQGNSALSNQDFNAARDAFSDALSIDPRNSLAMSGLAVAYAGLKEYAKAVPLLDRAALPNPSNRVMQYNAAAVHIDANTAMRAAKILRDYLQAHPAPLDEPMANALAIALAAADEQARKSSFYENVSQFYQSYNARLEAAAPGMKRWGIEWISATDYAAKQADIQDKQKSLDDANQKLVACDNRLADMRSQVPQMQERVQTGFEYQSTLDALNQRISEQQDRETQLVADRDAIVASIPKPSVPTTLDCVTAETLPPPGVHATVLADNTLPFDPDQPKPKPKAKKPKHVIPTPGSATPADSTGGGGASATDTDPPIVPKGITGVSTGDAPPAPETPTDQTDPTDSPSPAPVKRATVVQYAAAFPVAPDLLITAAVPLNGATKIELTTPDGNPMHAELVRSDAANGLALLRLTDQKVLYLSLADDFKGGAIQCAAFPTADMFNPTVEMLTGSAPAPVGVWKVRLSKHPRLPGAPLLVDGKVIGVQLAGRDALANELPSATLAQLKTFLGTDAPTAPGTASAAAVLLQLTATKAGN